MIWGMYAFKDENDELCFASSSIVDFTIESNKNNSIYRYNINKEQFYDNVSNGIYNIISEIKSYDSHTMTYIKR